MWRVHMMKYYSAIEKEVLSHAAVWMTLENIVLSKRSQKKKKSHIWCDTIFICDDHNHQIHTDLERISVHQELVEEGTEDR